MLMGGIGDLLLRALILLICMGGFAYVVFRGLLVLGPFGIPLLFVLAAAVLARPLASLFSAGAGGLYLPGRRYGRKLPMYSIAQGLRRRGEVEKSLDYYERIAREYPRERDPYVAMMQIAAVEMKNIALSDAIYQRALLRFKKARDQHYFDEMHRMAIEEATGVPRPGPERVSLLPRRKSQRRFGSGRKDGSAAAWAEARDFYDSGKAASTEEDSKREFPPPIRRVAFKKRDAKKRSE